MPIKISLESQVMLFSALFGPTSPEVAFLTSLIQHQGALVDTSLYMVRVVMGGMHYQAMTTVGTTSLIKGTPDPAVINHNRMLLREFLASLPGGSTYGVIPQSKPAPAAPAAPASAPAGWIMKNSTKVVVDPAASATGTASNGGPKEFAKSTWKKIKLKEAQTLGQPVFGTSDSATYRVVAVGPKIRLAVKRGTSEVSIRAESAAPLTEKEKQELTDAGLLIKSSYASIHLALGNIPWYRALGAFLYSLGDSIELTQKCETLAELEKACD